MCRIIGPEHWVNAEFVHFVDEHYEVMTEHLTQRFVDHRHVGLTAKRVAKFTLHHRERGFHVAAPVVVLQELIVPEHEVMKHFGQNPKLLGGSDLFGTFGANSHALWLICHSQHFAPRC
jgi:hypothetical protein